jgi:hypothetical protein
MPFLSIDASMWVSYHPHIREEYQSPICMYIFICKHLLCICIFIDMYIYIYLYKYTYVYIYLYMYVYIYASKLVFYHPHILEEYQNPKMEFNIYTYICIYKVFIYMYI